MAKEKTLEFVIRARDEYSRSLSAAKGALDKLAKANRNVQGRKNVLAGTKADAAAAGAAFRKAGQDAAVYGRALAKATKDGSRLTGENRKLARAFITARNEVRRTRAALSETSNTLSKVNGGFAAFSSRVDRTTISLQNQAAAARAAAAASRAAGAAGSRGRAGSALGGIAGKEIAALSSAKGRGILGLRPHELQNLSYQINDIVTGLVSGQKPMMIAAQQGGQIVQLFQRQALALARFAPAIAAATAVALPFFSAISRINERTGLIERFNSTIRLTGTESEYSAERLAPLAEELDRLGGSMGDASASIQAFIQAGLAEDRFRQFAVTARQMAGVMGVEVPEAASELANAFAGGFDAVLELDGKFDLFSASALESAIAMKKSGDEAGALNLLLADLEQRGGELADAAKGPWTRAFEDVAAAWNTFVDALANWSVIRGTIALIGDISGAMAGLVGSIARVVNALGGLAGAKGGFVSTAAGIIGDAALTALPGGAVLRLAGMNADEPTVAEVAPDNPDGPITNAQGPDLKGAMREEYKADQKAAEELADATVNALEDATDARAKAREGVREFNESLAESVAQTEFERSLIGQSNADRAVATALREAQNDALAAGAVLSDKQRAAIETSTRALAEATDAEKARGKAAGGGAKKQKEVNSELERRKVLEKEVSDLANLRTRLQSSIDSAEDSGDTTSAQELRDRLAEVNAELLTASDNMIAFWRKVGGPEAEAAILKLRQTKAEVADTGRKAVVTGKQMNEYLAGNGAAAFDKFAKAVVESGNAFESAKQAFLEFSSDFLREIARMILKQALLNALGGGSGGGGGIGGGIAGIIGKLFHSGGVVGSGGGMSRAVPMSAFAGAMRFHSGGLPGLKRNEVGAILKKGEEVLTEADPRHVGNGGGGGGNTRIVNAIDGASFLEEAMRSRRGESAILNYIKANPSAVRGALGV